jgi:hypothetical protein
VRRLELERLDALLAVLWPLAVAAQPDQYAIDRVLAIMARRARYLGLDAPEKKDVTSDGKPLALGVVAVDYRIAAAALTIGSESDTSASGEDKTS